MIANCYLILSFDFYSIKVYHYVRLILKSLIFYKNKVLLFLFFTRKILIDTIIFSQRNGNKKLATRR